MYENNLYNGSVLSDADIEEEMKCGNLFIAPYDKSQLQPAGYNLTPTRLIYSTKKKKLLPVYEKDEEVYVMIDKNETVLVRTRETLIVPGHLSGAFYSKVKVVSLGFGHVSTTLDPYWEGQLLISLNNPTNKKLKFSIEKNVYGKVIYNSFVTVQFMGVNRQTQTHADNQSGRLDIFEETLEHNVSVWKKKEIQQLRELVDDLRKCEKQKKENILLQKLNEDEKEEWSRIDAIQDEQQHDWEQKNFLAIKYKKYLRSIRAQVNEDANECIEIVNSYIEKKQKCLPVSYKFTHWLIGHLYEILGIIAIIGTMIIVRIPGEKFKGNPDIQKWLLQILIVYILFPIAKKISELIRDRIS